VGGAACSAGYGRHTAKAQRVWTASAGRESRRDKLPDTKLIITVEYYVDINILINSINKNNTKRLYIDAIYNFDLYSTLKEYSYYDQYKIDY